MYFSAKEFYDHATRNRRDGYDSLVRSAVNRPNGVLTVKDYGTWLNKIKSAIQRRAPQADDGTWIGKWLRPWDVVPKLRDFQAPQGDFGVGFEIELGFNTIQGSRQVANHVKNWQYITLDYEGGANPIELTFPPKPYSKLNKRSQVMRYLDYLTANSNLVIPHRPGSTAGTHVNVSLGGGQRVDYTRASAVVSCMQNIMGYSAGGSWGDRDWRTTPEHVALYTKYFGRRPYGWGYVQGNGKWIEWKLFHSTLDAKRFRQYVDIAVALTALIGSNVQINNESVLAALESGYNKSVRKTKKKTGSAESAIAATRAALAA